MGVRQTEHTTYIFVCVFGSNCAAKTLSLHLFGVFFPLILLLCTSESKLATNQVKFEITMSIFKNKRFECVQVWHTKTHTHMHEFECHAIKGFIHHWNSPLETQMTCNARTKRSLRQCFFLDVCEFSYSVGGCKITFGHALKLVSAATLLYTHWRRFIYEMNASYVRTN